MLSKDTDAKTTHKSADSIFFWIKKHLDMTKERFIPSAVITSGEKGDGPELPKLLAISQENGFDLEAVIVDGAYSGKQNLNKNVFGIHKIRITSRNIQILGAIAIFAINLKRILKIM